MSTQRPEEKRRAVAVSVQSSPSVKGRQAPQKRSLDQRGRDFEVATWNRKHCGLCSECRSKSRHCGACFSRDVRDAEGSVVDREHERVRRRTTGKCPITAASSTLAQTNVPPSRYSHRRPYQRLVQTHLQAEHRNPFTNA